MRGRLRLQPVLRLAGQARHRAPKLRQRSVASEPCLLCASLRKALVAAHHVALHPLVQQRVLGEQAGPPVSPPPQPLVLRPRANLCRSTQNVSAPPAHTPHAAEKETKMRTVVVAQLRNDQRRHLHPRAVDHDRDALEVVLRVGGE